MPRLAGKHSCLPLAVVNIQYSHHPPWKLTFTEVTVNMKMEI
jgi:pterin-4a-carbinolamine dehydratase